MTTLITVGDAEIRSVLEMQLPQRPIAWLGADADLIEANRHWLAPHFLQEGDTWSLNFQSWILRVDGKVIVVDPCNGNGRPHPMPIFDMLDIPFIERFEATGTHPDEVDYVFCTHMHHDHCGWNTQLRGGRWVPTFPNARYLFVQREFDRWNPRGANYQGVDYNEGVYERSILPVVEAGRADFLPDNYDLCASLRIEPAYGHTLGHSFMRLSSRREEAIFTGDAFHHPLQLTAPEIQFGDCDDTAEAVETRRKLVETALAAEPLLIPAHLPFPHAGWVRRRDGGIVFEGRL